MEKARRKEEEITDEQRSFLVQSQKFELKNNYFLYGDNVYWQQKGTAMGTRVASSFANLLWVRLRKRTCITTIPYMRDVGSIKDLLMIYPSYGVEMREPIGDYLHAQVRHSNVLNVQ